MSNINRLHERRDSGAYIAVIGVDGSGKSSCYKNVFRNNSQNSVAAIGDTVLLSHKGEIEEPRVRYLKSKLFLGPKVKNLRNRTLYKIFKFLELVLRVKIQDQIVRNCRPKVILTDGSPLINILAWGNYYHADIYNNKLCSEVLGYMTGGKIPRLRKHFIIKNIPEVFLANLLRVRFQKPDLVFFLKVSPAVALQRIASRGDKHQVHETEKFLQDLQDAYETVCEILKRDSEIVTVNTDDKTLEKVVDIVSKHVYENY